jgi:hypothetical protein
MARNIETRRAETETITMFRQVPELLIMKHRNQNMFHQTSKLRKVKHRNQIVFRQAIELRKTKQTKLSLGGLDGG